MADRPVFVREVTHLERPLILVRDDVEKAPHLVRHEAHCLHYVCGRPAHRIDPGLHFAEIRRLDPRDPGVTTLCTAGPVLRRLARSWLWQGQRLESNAACHCVDRNNLSDDADCLDIFLFAEAGGDDIAKPALAETPGVGAHTMNNLNDGLGQFVEAVVLARDRCRRQRFLASAAQRAIRGAARLGSDHRHFSGLEVSRVPAPATPVNRSLEVKRRSAYGARDADELRPDQRAARTGPGIDMRITDLGTVSRNDDVAEQRNCLIGVSRRFRGRPARSSIFSSLSLTHPKSTPYAGISLFSPDSLYDVSAEGSRRAPVVTRADGLGTRPSWQPPT